MRSTRCGGARDEMVIVERYLRSSCRVRQRFVLTAFLPRDDKCDATANGSMSPNMRERNASAMRNHEDAAPRPGHATQTRLSAMRRMPSISKMTTNARAAKRQHARRGRGSFSLYADHERYAEGRFCRAIVRAEDMSGKCACAQNTRRKDMRDAIAATRRTA